MTKLDYAIEYARRGWRVMPLHHIVDGVCTCHKAGCVTPGKHPRIMEPLKSATTDIPAIERWWGIWPDANIAIVTGKDSGIVALDVDPRHGGSEALKALQVQHGRIEERTMAKTGSGGFHLFFAHPGGHWANTQGTPTRPSPIGWGLDFRGDGGYVVAVGSDHISGRKYTWENAPNGHLPAMPQWLKDKLSNRQGERVAVPSDGEAEILTGNRHQTLRAWACGMRARGMSKAAIQAALIAENATRFAEPKPDDEVARLVDWVSGFKPGEVPNWRTVEPEQAEPPVEEIAQETSTPGLVSVRDVQAELNDLFYKGAQRGLKTGWDNLDQFYSVQPGDLTIGVAAPSAGKTTLAVNVVANMAILHDWKIAVCSTENRISMLIADLASMIAGCTYYGNFESRMHEAEKAFAEDFIHDHFRFISPIHTEPFTMQYVLSQARRMGADGVVVDPFGSLSLGASDGRNDSRLIRDLLHGVVQSFLKAEGMHMWLMVHTTKLPLDANGDLQMPSPYNASDSAGFYNAGDFLWGLRRPKSTGGQVTELAVQKVRDRFSGSIGSCKFTFDPMTGRYVDAGIIDGARSKQIGPRDEWEAPEF